MIELKRYIVDGLVKRDKIVADIKRMRLNKNDILELDKIKLVSDSYFGSENFERKSPAGWNSNYLDELSLVAVSETFNKEYLLYLNEVAASIRKKKVKKAKDEKLIKGIIIAILIFIATIFVILFTTSKIKKELAVLSVRSISLEENTYLCLVKVLQ